METKINLLGIVRNTTNLNSPAGACQELINLRKKYGTWRPIMPKLAIKTNFTSIDNTVFIHTMDDASYFIIYNPGDGTIKAYDSTTPFTVVETLLTIASKPTSLKFDTLGYYLIASDLESHDKYIFRCTPSAATKYVDVSNMPVINLDIITDATAITNNYLTKLDNDSFQAGWWLQEAYFRSLYAEYFEGYVFIRYGIELIDGTVLKHSAPLFLYVGNVTSTLGVNYVTLAAELIRVQYTIQATLPTDWTNYTDLIRGISIFMTKPVSKFDLDESGFSITDVYLGLAKKPNLLVDLFRNESAYYRVHHIPFNKIIGGGTGIVGSSKPIITSGGERARGSGASSAGTRGRGSGGSVPSSGGRREGFSVLSSSYNEATAYAAQLKRQEGIKDNPALFNITDVTSYDILSVDDVSHHNIIGFTSLNYNNRLFLFDIYTTLFNGYNIKYVITPGGGAPLAQYDIYIEVDLATEYGLKTIMQTMKCTYLTIKIPYILGYPDIRAKEIRILHNSGGAVKKAVFTLESHPVLNMSFATKFNGVDVNIAAKDTNGFQTIAIADISTAGTLATLATSLRDKNRTQLSDLFNPFVAPPINSYQVGEGNIVAAGVNMLPLEDKFGTFPVFVFTSRGIWALNLSDTGGIVISNITPVSSAVCINADSVIVVDNLLVFLASDGIKLLTGAVPSEISDIAEGPFTSALDGNTEYEAIKVHASINVVTDQISSTDILTYAAGAKFAYDKNLREIIVSNYNYGYSYIYSLDEKTWYKSNGKYKKFITQYPNVYALSTGNDLVDISQEQTSGNVGCFIETKPIPIGPDKEVKLNKTILGGRFDVATAFWGVLYMFGSNDGSVWSLLQGKEIEGQYIFNIRLPRMPISTRYIILCFSATLTKESSISEIRVIT